MTDLEITRLCAEAMGLPVFVDAFGTMCLEERDVDNNREYDPLHDDAQAMALVKKMRMSVMFYPEIDGRKAEWWRVDGCPPSNVTTRHADLNRAICECIAKMQAAK